MTLLQALSELNIPGKEKLISAIPQDLCDCCAVQFTPAMFSSLQKAVEHYAGEIPYTARIIAAREINKCCDAFFDYTFSKVCRLERIFDSTEMDILLIKELQGGSDESRYSQSQADRAEQFGMSTNAMQARIHALEEGKEILGHYVRINIAGRGRAAYDNTIHPVFLALNLKEAYFMTVEMEKAFKGTPFEQISKDIATDIYSQLSDYAQEGLQAHIRENGLCFQEMNPGELIPLREEKHDAVFFLKSGEPCVLHLADGRSFIGRVRLITNELVLETSDGSIVPLPEDEDCFFLMRVK